MLVWLLRFRTVFCFFFGGGGGILIQAGSGLDIV